MGFSFFRDYGITVFLFLFSVFCFLFSVFRSPFSVLRSPFSVLRSPFSVLRFPFSVLRSPFSLSRPDVLQSAFELVVAAVLERGEVEQAFYIGGNAHSLETLVVLVDDIEITGIDVIT